MPDIHDVPVTATGTTTTKALKDWVKDIATGSTTGGGGGGPPATGTKWVQAYYAGWYRWSRPLDQVNYNSFTHGVMFTLIPNADGTIVSEFYQGGVAAGTAFAVDFRTRCHAAGRKALLCIGGGGYGARFQSAIGAANRAALVTNVINKVIELGYDGVDIDYEHSPFDPATDGANLVAFAQELRAARPTMILTAAIHGFLNINQPDASFSSAHGTFYVNLFSHLDWASAMTYSIYSDAAGWETWHISPIYGAKSTTPSDIDNLVQKYVSFGISKAKLGIGMSVYADGFGPNATGPNQVIAGNTTWAVGFTRDEFNSFPQTAPAGVWNQWDNVAKASYASFSPAHPIRGTNVSYFSYMSSQAIQEMASYIKAQGLGGAIVWQLGGDTANSTVTQALYTRLNG